MSRLIDIDPDMKQLPEEDGHEFGYYAFDILPPIEVNVIGDENDEQDITNVPVDVNKLENLIQLQLDDPFCSNILKQLTQGNLIERQPYFVEDYILHRIIKEHDSYYETIVVPRDLIPQVLRSAHGLLGHNGIGRMYATIKRLYYWKGMKPTITKYIQNCYKCQQ